MKVLLQKLLITDFLRILEPLSPILRWKIYGLFLLSFLVAIFEVLSILSLSLTAMSVAAPQTILNNHYLQLVLQEMPELDALCRDPRYLALFISLCVVILMAVKNALTAILFWRQSAISEEISLYAGDVILSNYLENPYIWHISGDSNQTLMALGARSALARFIVKILNVYTYAGTAIALVFILITGTPAMILLVLVFTGVLAWAVYSSMKKSLDRSGQRAVKGASSETRTINNALHGIREVLIYRQQPVFRQKFMEACISGQKARAFLSMAPPIPTWILEVYGFAAIPFTIWILIRFYDADIAMVAGVVTMLMLVAWRILPLLNRSLSNLVVLRSERPMAMICLERLETIKKQGRSHSMVDPDPDFQFQESIQLQDASFKYPAAKTPALVNLTCTLPKGAQVGLVGLSGSGKSTLAGILSGLITPGEGKFLLDDLDPTPAELAAYRSKVGYVPQTPYLMAGTIAENVAFSQWGKPFDEKRVLEACRQAALDIVETDSRGINYPLGENGSGLSGGQAQRVAIARALYANPEILILDESTSALDQQTETAIMNTIQNLRHTLTTIIIAHRLTTVEQCDWIIWLEMGRIKMQGKTADVLREYKASMSKGK